MTTRQEAPLPDDALSAVPVDAVRNNWSSRLFSSSSPIWIFFVLVLIVVGFTIASPGKFLTVFDVKSMLINASIDLAMAVGMTFVIVTAGIDLSVGSVLVFSGVLAMKTITALAGSQDAAMKAGWGIITVGLLVGLVAGLAWGVVWNGLLVAKAKVPPFIVTLASYGAALGLAEVLTGGNDAIDVPAKLVSSIGTGQLGPFPWLVVIAFVVVVLGGLSLNTTRFGRYTIAIGSNEEGARRAGIGVDRHLVKVYGVCGLLAGLAGVMSLAHFDTTSISSHANDNLVVITGVLLGGTSMFGGEGTMFGTVIGTLIPVALEAGLVIIGVQTYWQQVAVGIVLVAAVFIDQLRRRSRNKS